jgi:transposase InsO family protein
MRYTHLQVLKTKDEAFEAYKSFAAWAQTQHGVCIKRLHSDCGGEFLSNQFTTYLRQQGTERRLMTVDTPQHNGVAESLNRRLMERTRAILHQADLPKYLWVEAIQFTVWLKNRTSMKTLGVSTPHE